MASTPSFPLLEYHWPHTGPKITDSLITDYDTSCDTSCDTAPASTYVWEPTIQVNDSTDPIDISYGMECFKPEPPRYTPPFRNSTFYWNDDYRDTRRDTYWDDDYRDTCRDTYKDTYKDTHRNANRHSSKYDWPTNTSKIRSDYDEDDFHGWYEAIEADATRVCWLLKAGQPIPPDLKYVHTNILEPLVGLFVDAEEDVENMMSLYYDAMADIDDANRYPDIAKAINLLKEDMPLPPCLEHINEGALRVCMTSPDSREIVLVSRDGLEPTFEDVETLSMADIIYKYNQKMKRFKEEEEINEIVDAFTYVYTLMPLPPHLLHMRADLLGQLMEVDAMAEIGMTHIDENIDLDHPDTHEWICDTYKGLLALDRRTDSLIETLAEHYEEYTWTGDFPKILGADYDLLSQLAVMVETHPELNKHKIITDKVFITASIRSLGSCSHSYHSV